MRPASIMSQQVVLTNLVPAMMNWATIVQSNAKIDKYKDMDFRVCIVAFPSIRLFKQFLPSFLEISPQSRILKYPLHSNDAHHLLPNFFRYAMVS